MFRMWSARELDFSLNTHHDACREPLDATPRSSSRHPGRRRERASSSTEASLARPPRTGELRSGERRRLGVAKHGIASGPEPEDRRFKSCHSDQEFSDEAVAVDAECKQ